MEAMRPRKCPHCHKKPIHEAQMTLYTMRSRGEIIPLPLTKERIFCKNKYCKVQPSISRDHGDGVQIWNEMVDLILAQRTGGYHAT